MPSKSPTQKRLMAAAAHTKGGFGGVPQAVGKEFNKADTRGSPKSKEDHMARVAKHSTQKETGKAFGKSQPTVSRTLRQGFNRIGGAND